MKARWNFDAPIIKAFKDSNGKMHVKAIASDNLEDAQGDRMSTEAIVSMATQANKNATQILPSHHDAFSIGKVHEARSVHKKSRVQFAIDVELDENFPQAVKLFKSVKKRNKEFQLSIGGFLNLDNDDAFEFEETKDGRIVRVINDIILDHIAVTRKDMAANKRTGFRSAVIKSIEHSMNKLDEDDEEMKNDKKRVDKKDEDDKNDKDDVEDKVVEDKNDDVVDKKDDKEDEVVLSNEEKLASIVTDLLDDFCNIHKSDDKKLTDDQIEVIKSMRDDMTEFLKEVGAEDDVEDDNAENKSDLSTRMDELQKSVEANSVGLAKAMKSSLEEIDKSISSIRKSRQSSGRINTDDNGEARKDNVWDGIITGKKS